MKKLGQDEFATQSMLHIPGLWGGELLLRPSLFIRVR